MTSAGGLVGATVWVSFGGQSELVEVLGRFAISTGDDFTVRGARGFGLLSSVNRESNVRIDVGFALGALRRTRGF
jgi:hypothetical protein